MKKLIFIFFVLPLITKSQSIATGDSLGSNIVYYNITDKVMQAPPASSYQMDLDSNSIMDIQFDVTLTGGMWGSYFNVNLKPLSPIDFITTSSQPTWMDTLSPGSVINASANWNTYTTGCLLKQKSVVYYPVSSTSTAGIFSGINKYFGFRLKRTTDTLYGWMLLNVEQLSIGGVIIKSYAINKSCSSVGSLSLTSSANLICSAASSTLNASGAYSYTWSTGGNGPSVAVTPSVTTTYSVNGTGIMGCQLSSIITQSVDACAGIEEHEIKQIKIFPNPVTNNLNISDGTEFQNSEIEIVNYLGQTIFKMLYTNTIDVSKLANGIYTLKITSPNNKSVYAKFVKE